jgi:two-component system sporulation sensor kinase C
MSASYVTDFASAVEAGGSEGSRHGRVEVGVSIREPMISRVIEGSLSQLDLVTVPIAEDLLDLESHGGSVWETKLESLVGFEMIVADEPEARRIVGLFERRRESGEGVYPAVIAVVTRGEDGTLAGSDDVARDAGDSKYDAVLWLPKPPAAVAAQMSLVLYAHRRFARRYQTAMDELNLNRRIFRSVTSGISIADATKPDLPLTYVNPAFEVMTGYSLEEVLGKNCRFLQGDALDQPAITLVREAIRDKRETLVILKNYRKDGTPFWNELSLSPIRNRHGMLTHFVGIQTDVTARVEFEDALRESEKLAAVGRLASSIAHEINNPLESVMNLIYLAQMPGSDAQSVKTYLSMADKELQRVKVITSQSLRFYKQSTKPQVTGTKELLNSVVDVYQARLQNGHVEVERRERSKLSIVCMESEIRQVLSNLVGNAIDAMKGEVKRLLVRSREATDWRTGARGVLMTIADTGAGMSAETKKDIYKAFYTTKGIGGTGLGLWISSEIVSRHNGRLMVRSRQGERSGTVFALFLPHQGKAPEGS